MDWKSFYRDELLSPEGQEYLGRCLEGLPDEDEAVDAVIARGGVLSFPHTALFPSAPVTGRVVAALYRAGVKHVIALGVLHGSALPREHRRDFTEYQRLTGEGTGAGPPADKIFERYRGGLLPEPPLVTAFGELPCCRTADPPEDLVRFRPDLLQGEFSLDTFLSCLAFYARRHGCDAPPVLPLYVGLVRGPDGNFDTATGLAAWLTEIVGRDTAVVCTGDPVHYGHAYCARAEMEGLPGDGAELTTHFHSRVEDALGLAFHEHDYDRYHRLARGDLRSDNVNLVPVVAEYLGRRAEAELLSFELSDYANILGVAPPCLVASALAAYLPRARPDEDPREHDYGAEALAP